jgi:outer membrane murein-binding lipoprotein Lpp
MNIKTTGAVLLGIGAAGVVSMAATPGLAADSLQQRRAEMQQEIQKLEARLNALERKREQVRRRVAAAAAVEAGSRPRSWKLPGTNTSMQIGGFAQLSLIYDFNQASGDAVSSDGASGSSFPSRGSAGANRQQHFRLHARRTRFFVKTWTPTDYGTLHTRIETDFFGDGGNEVASNSNPLRVRQAWASLGPVTAGQTDSLFRFTDFEMWTFQDRGMAANGNGRQAQLRYSHNFGGGNWLLFSVENPETSGAIVSRTYVDPVVVSGGGAPDEMPEIVVAALHTWSNGRFKIAGIIGRATMDDGVGSNDRATTWAVQGAFRLRFNNKRTEFSILGFYGRGMGRYWRGTQNYAIAVTGVNGSNVNIRAIPVYGGYAWVSHKWTNTITTNVGFGRVDADVERYIDKANMAGRVLDVHWSFLANIVWSPVPDVRMGIEYHWLRSNFHNANESQIHRLQFSARYYF